MTLKISDIAVVPDRTSPPVVLINIGGLQWSLLHPLIDDGLLPNLSKALDTGVMGAMASPTPRVAPMLWTDLITGQLPIVHGIGGGVSGDGEPVRPADRNSPTLWEIAAQQGLSPAVVGGVGTHAADRTHGIVVSEFHGSPYLAVSDEFAAQCVSHDSLASLALDAWVRPEEVGIDTIEWFVPDWQSVNQKSDPRIALIADAVAFSLSRHAVLVELLEHHNTDLLIGDYPLLGQLGHVFLPEHVREHADDEATHGCYSLVMRRACEMVDTLIGRLMACAGKRANVLLTSHFGYRLPFETESRKKWLTATPEWRTFHEGIFLGVGPAFSQDTLLHGVNITDVAPTVLHLLGLPIGLNMPGRVLLEGLVNKAPPQTTDAWLVDTSTASAQAVVPTSRRALLQEHFRRLGALPSAEPKNELGQDRTHKGGASPPTISGVWQWNLARSYIGHGANAKALPLLENLVESAPGRFGILMELIKCQLKLGLVSEAQEYALELSDYAPNSPLTVYVFALVERAAGRHEEALQHIENAIENHGAVSVLIIEQVKTLLRLRRFEPALAALQAHGVDDAQTARLRTRALLGLKRLAQAEEQALKAIGMDYQRPYTHYMLGIALLGQSLNEEAIIAFSNAVRFAPSWPLPHAQLLRLKRRGQPGSNTSEIALETHRTAIKNYDLSKQYLAEIKAQVMVRSQQRQRERNAQRAHSMEYIFDIDDEIATTTRPQVAMNLTLVSGLPRAGASAVLGMLQAGGIELMADEPNGLVWTAVKEIAANPKVLEAARGKVIYIPSSLLAFLPRIHHYTIIFVNRALGELVVSQRNQLVAAGELKQALPLYEQGRLLLTHRNAVWRRLSGAPNVSLLSIEFQQLLSIPDIQIERVRALLGEDLLPDRTAMLVHLDSRLQNVSIDSNDVPRELKSGIFSTLSPQLA